MGKAVIIGSGARNLQRGQYRVRIEKSDERTIAQAKQLDIEIRSLDDIIPTRSSAYIDARNTHSRAESDLDSIIQQSIESPTNDYTDKLNSAIAAERAAFTNLAKAKSQYQTAVMKQKSLQNQRLYLEVNETDDIRTVWCADCQRNLSGEVATIEIPNTDDKILIRPGGADGSGSEYSRTRDGQLRSVLAMSPAEAAYNYALLPGWQKWFPTYRLGKITSRPPGSSKCSVLLDIAASSDNLNINKTRQLTNVPMVYKNRDDGGPYVVGDRVVVEFVGQNPDVPRVVGFEDYPCTTSSSSSSTTTSLTSTTTSITYPAYMYIQDSAGTILVNNADTGAFIGPLGNTPYCPGAPPCVFRGLATTGAKIINGALFHRKIIVMDSTGAIENVYTDAFTQIFGSPPPAYPTKRWKGIQCMDYDPITGNLVSIANDPVDEINGYVVIHDGISDTILSANHLIIPGPIQCAPHSITVVDGDLVIYATYTIPAPGASIMVTMDGISTTVKTVIAWPIANRYLFMTSHNGNVIGTGIIADPKNVVLHDGVTPTILGSFYLPYDPYGISVLDD